MTQEILQSVPCCAIAMGQRKIKSNMFTLPCSGCCCCWWWWWRWRRRSVTIFSYKWQHHNLTNHHNH